MFYEILKGQPSAGKCEIGAYEDNELMATYDGYYDWKKCTWKLYPKKRYALPLGQAFGAITLTERDVHVRRAVPPPKAIVEKVSEAVKAEPKTKAWWALPDPEGQMKLF